MTDNDTITSERLDRSYSTRTKQPLKRGQLALTFEHQPHNLALRGSRVRPQHCR
jgi:hypothetical protein